MKALLIGCGEGGSKLVEMIMKIQRATCGADENGEPIKKQFDALILNTALRDLEMIDPKNIALGKNRKLLVGSGYTPAAGHGAGGNPRLGAIAATSDYWRIAAKIEEILNEIKDNKYMGDIEAFIVCAALGGGSGSGMGPVVAQLLKENYFEDQYPVIGLVILPAKEEGKLYAYNAHMSLLTWLRESNFDGIITVTLGGKFLNYRDDQEKYYARFDKSVAKALYILFGGETIEQDVNVDTSDILSTIKDGGGVCTLAHLSTKVHLPLELSEGSETEKTERIAGEKGKSRLGFLSRLRKPKADEDILKDLGLSEEEEGKTEEGWQASTLLKLVKRACNRSNMFLPVDFRKAKAALMVVKDTEEFQVPTGALQAAKKWVEDNIDGVVRYTTISYRKFRLNTVDRDVFEDYEVTSEDEALSENKTLEIAILFSGFEDVELFREYRRTAEIVKRLTSPPKGLRLVAESYGIPIGETMEDTFLPCSAERVNTAAMTQCKATLEAVNKFVKDLSIMNPDLTEDEIRKSIKVLDVKPVPEIYCCSTSTMKEKIRVCYEVHLKFVNKNDDTYFKRRYIVKVVPEKIEKVDGGQKVSWKHPEFLRVMDDWNKEEMRVIKDVLAEVMNRDKFRSYYGSEVDRCDVYITGLCKYPSCSEENIVEIYKVKVANLKRIVMASGDRESLRRVIIDSLSKDPCSGEHTKYFKYFYWISTDKQGVVWECEEFDRSRIVESTRDTPIDREVATEPTAYSKEELEKVREIVDESLNGCTYEDIRDEKYYERLIKRPDKLEYRKQILANLGREFREQLINELRISKDISGVSDIIETLKTNYFTINEVLDIIDEISVRLRRLKPKLKEKFEIFVDKILEKIEDAIKSSSAEKDVCRKYTELLRKINYVLSRIVTSEQQDAVLKCIQSNRWKELNDERISILENVLSGKASTAVEESRPKDRSEEPMEG